MQPKCKPVTSFAKKMQKLRHICIQLMAGVISTAGLNKFNIIPKAFIPNTASILLLQKVIKR
jgi:hypothetical protein